MTTQGNHSLAESIALLPETQRLTILQGISLEDANKLLFDWLFWARPNQIAPLGDWRTWLVLAGRGFGKTRIGAEWVRAEIESGRRKRMALVARTAADVRDVMVEGESGILNISSPWFKPKYEPSKRRLTWPNGAIATTFTADEPALLRGPQHDGAWCDELASWRYPETLDMLLFGLRLGDDPRMVCTTTPRPVKHLKELIANSSTIVTRGSTYENLSNLAPVFLSEVIAKYKGTRLGRQELDAELLEDVPGALWQRTNLDDTRVRKAPEMKRVVVAIDPPGSEDGAEAGIVVCGLGEDDHGYVLADLSGQASPARWGRLAVEAYHEWKADKIIGEANNGGDMVGHTVRTVEFVPFKKVHASRGKFTRAEPVSSLYDLKKIHHVGVFPELEDQMCTWLPGETSPDRMDALVWGFTELMIGKKPQRKATSSQG